MFTFVFTIPVGTSTAGWINNSRRKITKQRHWLKISCAKTTHVKTAKSDTLFRRKFKNGLCNLAYQSLEVKGFSTPKYLFCRCMLALSDFGTKINRWQHLATFLLDGLPIMEVLHMGQRATDRLQRDNIWLLLTTIRLVADRPLDMKMSKPFLISIGVPTFIPDKAQH